MSQAVGSHTSNYCAIGKLHRKTYLLFCTARTNENIDMKAMPNPLACNCCHTLASPFSSTYCHLLLGGFPVSPATLALQ